MTNFPLLAVFVESKIGYASTFYYSCWFPIWSLNVRVWYGHLCMVCKCKYYDRYYE